MYIKKTNFAIYLGVAALVGFAASALFITNGSQEGLLSGDISKVNRYSNVKEDPEVSVIEERLQNDQEFQDNTRMAMDLLRNRVSTLADLTDLTLKVCSSVPELDEALRGVVSLNAKAYNTNVSIARATESLGRLISGHPAPDYEQMSNSAFVGFQKIENQLAVGKVFVEAATEYLEDKNSDEYRQIAELVSVWSVYCAQDASLNKSESDMAYWDEKFEDMGSNTSILGAVYGEMTDIVLNNVAGGGTVDGILNNGQLGESMDLLKDMMNGADNLILQNGSILENGSAGESFAGALMSGFPGNMEAVILQAFPGMGDFQKGLNNSNQEDAHTQRDPR